MTGRFGHFAAIDWSGAVGERHGGIALAICETGTAAPRLVSRGHRWSREDVLHWLLDDMPADTLVGLDLGISLPFADCGAFFPGWEQSPPDARALWAMVDQVCSEDAHLAASSFIDHPDSSPISAAMASAKAPGSTPSGERPARPLPGYRAGPGANRLQAILELQPHWRGAGRQSEPNRHARAASVGRSPAGLADRPAAAARLDGGRDLHLDRRARCGTTRVARSKMRSHEDLNAALAAMHSRPSAGSGPLDDHSADALLTAAWLRANAERRELWHPPDMTLDIARTEGWTFGAA